MSTRYYQKFYLNPNNMTTLYCDAINKGLNAIHVPSDPIIIGAIIEAINNSGIDNFVLATIEGRDLSRELDLCKRIEAESIIVHGSFTDRSVDNLKDILRRIKNYSKDIPTGIATHSPGNVIPKILQYEEVDIILAPINIRGSFMEPTVQSTLKSIAKARAKGRRVIAMKALGAGLIEPEDAFHYISRKVDGVAVGITSSTELNRVLSVAQKYF
ncbi:hypothetical protein [[Eubacterium] cellulosolvens]